MVARANAIDAPSPATSKCEFVIRCHPGAQRLPQGAPATKGGIAIVRQRALPETRMAEVSGVGGLDLSADVDLAPSRRRSRSTCATVALDDEVAAHTRHPDAAGAIAADVELDPVTSSTSISPEVSSSMSTEPFTPRMSMPPDVSLDPHVAAGVAHTNVARCVIDPTFAAMLRWSCRPTCLRRPPRAWRALRSRDPTAPGRSSRSSRAGWGESPEHALRYPREPPRA